MHALKDRRLLVAMLAVCLCLFSTGCLRMGVAALVNFMPGAAMSPHPPPSVMVTDTYFDGTRHVAPLVLSPLAPIAIIDLPLEVIWDVFIFPTQLSMKASRRESARRMIAEMNPSSLAENGYFDEFKKRVQSIDSEQKTSTMANLARPFAKNPDKLRQYVDYLFSLDHSCGDLILDSLYFKNETALTSHLFELGLNPADFPHEHAVFNAIKYIRQHIYGRPPEYSTERQFERVRILLENGCNPNSIPEYNCKYVSWSGEDFEGETSLDMARIALDAFKKNGNEKEASFMKEIVLLLEKHGAKTAQELNLSRWFKSIKLKDFYEKRHFGHFKARMVVADRSEKEEAMLSIMRSGAPVKEFEPFCRLLLDDGIPFPDKAIIYGTPPKPRQIEAIEFAFANGLKGSDYPESPVIFQICSKFISFKEYDAGYIELLRLLLKNGFNPNVIFQPNTKWARTALSELERALRIIDHGFTYDSQGNLNTSPGRRKMVVEAIELLKQNGGLSLQDANNLLHNKGLPK